MPARLFLPLLAAVIPAKAGIQGRGAHRLPWVPAFAGTTTNNRDYDALAGQFLPGSLQQVTAAVRFAAQIALVMAVGGKDVRHALDHADAAADERFHFLRIVG